MTTLHSCSFRSAYVSSCVSPQANSDNWIVLFYFVLRLHECSYDFSNNLSSGETRVVKSGMYVVGNRLHAMNELRQLGCKDRSVCGQQAAKAGKVAPDSFFVDQLPTPANRIGKETLFTTDTFFLRSRQIRKNVFKMVSRPSSDNACTKKLSKKHKSDSIFSFKQVLSLGSKFSITLRTPWRDPVD